MVQATAVRDHLVTVTRATGRRRRAALATAVLATATLGTAVFAASYPHARRTQDPARVDFIATDQYAEFAAAHREFAHR